MHKLITSLLITASLLCGCSHAKPDSVTRSPDDIQAPTKKPEEAKRIVPFGSKEITQDNWSFIVPSTFKTVKASPPFDTTLISDDGFLRVSFFSRESSSSLAQFFLSYKSIVGTDALLVQAVIGTINGKKCLLTAFATQPSTATIAYLTVDSKKEYALNCSMDIDNLKVSGQKCIDIAQSIIIK